MISRSEITFAIHNVVWKLNSISLLELFSSPDKVLCHLVLHYCLFEFGSLSDLKLSGPWYSSRRLSLALVADSLNQWIMPCREKVLSLLWVIQWQCLKWYSMISDVSHWSLDWFLSQSRTVHSVTNQISLKCYLLWSPSELTICLVLSHHDFRLFGSISTLSPSCNVWTWTWRILHRITGYCWRFFTGSHIHLQLRWIQSLWAGKCSVLFCIWKIIAVL